MARPRHSGERYRGGKLRARHAILAADRGSEYLIAHRARAAGSDNARDPLAGYPLGVARLRGIVCQAHLDAGLRYAVLSAIVWGGARNEASHLGKLLPSTGGEDWQRPTGSPAEHERWRARKEVELRAAVEAVRGLPTSRPFHLLENVIVYEHRPRFLETTERRRTPGALLVDLADRAALDLALGTLAALWGMKCE